MSFLLLFYCFLPYSIVSFVHIHFSEGLNCLIRDRQPGYSLLWDRLYSPWGRGIRPEF